MTPAIRFPHDTSLETAHEGLQAIGCILGDLGRPGDDRMPDASRITRRSVQPHIGHATVSHVAGVVILSTPAGAPLPGDRWMRRDEFETGSMSAMRLLVSTVHELAGRILGSVGARRPGVPTVLADDLGAAEAVRATRALWMTHGPHGTIGICPETPWSPASWIRTGMTRGDPLPNALVELLGPLVDVRIVRTGMRSTAKICAHPVVVGPIDPVARMRAVSDAADMEGDL